MTGKSAIYHGSVVHARHLPKRHEFRYGLSLLAIDLDDLPELFAKRLLVSVKRPAPWRFKRSDYLGPASKDLKDAVRDSIAERTGFRPTGPIVLVTQLRAFGFIFNPVSFYFAYEGDEVQAMLAEITNTPWLERHHYVLGPDQRQPHGGFDGSFDKTFHISPFMGMNQDYHWRFSSPGKQLDIQMETREEASPMLNVHMQLERQPFSAKNLNAMLLRQPFMTLQVAFGIYWQALQLKWKGLPFFDHPKTIIPTKECPGS